jgi:hypothetical protein
MSSDILSPGETASDDPLPEIVADSIADKQVSKVAKGIETGRQLLASALVGFSLVECAVFDVAVAAPVLFA